jgi:hypothetical protein
VGLGDVTVAMDGPAVGRKAVCFPGRRAIFLDSATWDRISDVNGRRAVLFHEVGHAAGARCERCADWYAGHLLRREGVATDRDALRTLLSLLDNRDPVRAAGDLHAGYGGGRLCLELEGGLDPLAGAASQRVTGYRGGQSFPLTVWQISPGQWAEEATARAWLAAAADHGAARVASGWRDWAKQADLYEGYKAGRPGYNPADPPGYSKHQDGTAVDGAWDSEAERERFAQLAAARGLSRPVSREPWHFVHAPASTPAAPASQPDTPGGGSAAPLLLIAAAAAIILLS